MNVDQIINHVRNIPFQERKELIYKIISEYFSLEKIASENYLAVMPNPFWRFKKQKLEISDIKEIVEVLKPSTEEMLFQVVHQLSKLYNFDDLYNNEPPNKSRKIGLILLAGKYLET